MAAGSGWTSARVLALAPDPAAARVGQGLIALKKWSNLGQGPNLLWGECQGSGTKPYQTKIAPDDPAFSCSCPSRKFPCKHAIALMLIWVDADSPVTEANPPPWVATWVESRAQRAEAKQAKVEAAEAAPVDPAARVKREAARLAKVTAGLDDLDLWLGDLVRSGFATLGSRSKTLWAEQARRLVDAQCPGVARRLRQIDAMSLVGEGWQTALLDRLAQLHLLVEGFRHRDRLPSEVLADVRTAIGFPADLDGVRSGTTGTQVRDTWRVLGQAFALEEKIIVRRTWLWGRDSRRAALILDFAAPGRPLEVHFEPGTQVDATLGFLPGAAPIRALPIDRHAPAEPVASLNGGTSIAEAQSAFGAVLARSPWTEVVAVILADVVLGPETDGWSVIDPTGAGLPLSKRFDQGWQVVALSGGDPITLTAEFNGSTLNPLGAICAGEYLVLSSPSSPQADDAGTGSPGRWLTPESSLLRDATASAVVGVERKPPPVPPDHPLGVVLAPAQVRPGPARLLAIAATAGLYARVGRTARVTSAPPPTVFDPISEDRPECPRLAADRLRRLFSDEFEQNLDQLRLVPEWVVCCHHAGQRLPADLLVPVLTWHEAHSEVSRAVVAIIGARGRWLANRHPDWSRHASNRATEDTTVWETGTKAERLNLFRRLRRTDPATAKRLIDSTFKSESADLRASLIHAAEIGLSQDDEPWLEAALDDRSQEVRQWATKRLRCLPQSRLAARMTERAKALLRWDGDHLIVEKPVDADPTMVRDGIKRDYHEQVARHPIGQRAWYLHEILTMTPVAAIADHLGQPIAAILRQASDPEWVPVLVDAWEIAALRQHDRAWCRALALNQIATGEYQLSDRFPALLATLDPTERDALIAAKLAAGPDLIWGTNPAIRLIIASEALLHADLGRVILRQIEMMLKLESAPASGTDPEYFTKPYQTLRTFIEGLDRKLPFDLVAEALAVFAPQGIPAISAQPMSLTMSFAAMLERWQFRRDMHQEFAPQ